MKINEQNILVFDFIFNVNMQHDEFDLNKNKYVEKLDSIIMNETNSNTNYYFWKEHKSLLIVKFC